MNAKFDRAMCMAFSASPKASALLAEAVKEDGLVLEALPDKMKTPELCRAAVENNGYALRAVPKKLLTEELCRTAMHRDHGAFQYVPDSMKTPEFCREAVEEWPFALAFVPEKLRTAELCILSLEKGGEGDPEIWIDNGRDDEDFLDIWVGEGWESPEEAVEFWPLVPGKAKAAVEKAAEEFMARNEVGEDEEDDPRP